MDAATACRKKPGETFEFVKPYLKKQKKQKHRHYIIGIIHDLHNLFGGNIPSGRYKEVYCAAKAD